MYKDCVPCPKIGVSCKGPNFMAMTAAEILEWCRLRIKHLKISHAKLAELSGVPKGTIDRLLSGEHLDFKHESIRPILIILVGGTFDGDSCSEPIMIDDHKQTETIERLQTENAALKETIQAYEHMHHEDMQELREEHQQAIDYLKKQIKDQKIVSLLLSLGLVIATVALILVL